MITLCVVTDGRDDCLARTIGSLDRLHGPISRRILYDDTGDPEHRHQLASLYPDFSVTYAETGRQGFGGTLRFLWAYLAQHEKNPWLFWLEDDFVLERDVFLDDMIAVMDKRPHLQQMVLRRQAWNAEEQAAGGIIEQHPDDYFDCHDGEHDWVEHRRFWSTNPHLARTLITQVGWPDDPHSEGQFTQRLLRNPRWRFAFWEHSTSRPLVTHIGQERAGVGY